MGAIYNQSSQDTPRYIHTSSFLEILTSTRDNGIGSEKEGLNRERNKEESRTWKTLKPNSSWSIIIFHPVSFLSLFSNLLFSRYYFSITRSWLLLFFLKTYCFLDFKPRNARNTVPFAASCDIGP